jgi:hypothetical protein
MKNDTQKDKNGSKTAKSAHHGHNDARVVMVKPMVVTAGGSLSSAPIQAARLVMAGNPKPVLEGLPGYTPVIIRLDWPDMSVPCLSSADWKWLTGRIRALRRPLHVSCAMGHGRTGTCLAILAHFWGQLPRGADPVQWVRDNYCADAVESISQIGYIERITGRPSTCKAKEPAWEYGRPYGSEYNGGSGWTAPKTSGKVSSYFPDNAANKRDGGSVLDDVTSLDKLPPYPGTIVFCNQTVNGFLCTKPAEDGQAVCAKHLYEGGA